MGLMTEQTKNYHTSSKITNFRERQGAWSNSKSMSIYGKLYIRLSPNLVALARTVPEICEFIQTELVKFARYIQFSLCTKFKYPSSLSVEGIKIKHR